MRVAFEIFYDSEPFYILPTLLTWSLVDIEGNILDGFIITLAWLTFNVDVVFYRSE